MKLHIDQLIEKRACPRQIALFRSMFGESVNITQKLCLSVADKFDFNWAAHHLLSEQSLAEYERVLARTFDEAQAMAECRRVLVRTFARLYNVTAACRVLNRYLRLTRT